MQRQLLQDGLKTAHVAPVSADDIVTAACQLQRFDLTSMTPQDAEFNAHFTLQASPSVSIQSVRMCLSVTVIWTRAPVAACITKGIPHCAFFWQGGAPLHQALWNT